jgi:tRNA (guanine37-N1)-methyltransferase
VIYLSPQGQRLDQAGLARLAQYDGLILVAGRYEGIDERVIDAQVDEEYSIGDYVLSGGELPAMVLIDGITRLIPGAVGDPESIVLDSFQAGLLDYPQYTRPEEGDGVQVPPVLLGGNHQEIQRWRLKQALGRTYERRPDMLKGRELDKTEQQLLDEYLQENLQANKVQ